MEREDLYKCYVPAIVLHYLSCVVFYRHSDVNRVPTANNETKHCHQRG